jgi:hypothetical protein
MAHIFPDWLLKNPHRPPNDLQGDRLPGKIYEAVGYVTHRWEGVEAQLSVLFSQFLGGGAGQPSLSAIRAYGAILGSGARMDMLVAAIETALWHEPNKKAQYESIIGLIGVCRRLAALRNAIAHGTVISKMEETVMVIYQRPASPRNYFIVPTFTSTSKTSQIGYPKTWYSSATIRMIGDAMEMASDNVFGCNNSAVITCTKEDSLEGWSIKASYFA